MAVTRPKNCALFPSKAKKLKKKSQNKGNYLKKSNTAIFNQDSITYEGEALKPIFKYNTAVSIRKHDIGMFIEDTEITPSTYYVQDNEVNSQTEDEADGDIVIPIEERNINKYIQNDAIPKQEHPIIMRTQNNEIISTRDCNIDETNVSDTAPISKPVQNMSTSIYECKSTLNYTTDEVNSSPIIRQKCNKGLCIQNDATKKCNVTVNENATAPITTQKRNLGIYILEDKIISSGVKYIGTSLQSSVKIPTKEFNVQGDANISTDIYNPEINALDNPISTQRQNINTYINSTLGKSIGTCIQNNGTTIPADAATSHAQNIYIEGDIIIPIQDHDFNKYKLNNAAIPATGQNIDSALANMPVAPVVFNTLNSGTVKDAAIHLQHQNVTHLSDEVVDPLEEQMASIHGEAATNPFQNIKPNPDLNSSYTVKISGDKCIHNKNDQLEYNGISINQGATDLSDDLDEQIKETLQALQDIDAKMDVHKSQNNEIEADAEPGEMTDETLSERCRKCLLCKKIFKDQDSLVNHIGHTHAALASYTCMVCLRLFRSPLHLNNHKHSKHPYLHCPQCPKIYPNEKELNYHIMRSHPVEDEEVSCPTCNVTFTQKYLLHLHIRKVHTIKANFRCPHCDKTFKTKPCYRKHISWVHREDGEKYECETCAEVLSDAVLYRTHKIKEHAAGEFMCEDCGQMFRHKKSLVRHNDNPINVKPKRMPGININEVPCEICGRMIPGDTAMFWHMETCHKNDARHCRVCNKKCSSHKDLTEHMQVSHDEEVVKCTTCSQTFESQKHLLYHVESAHATMELVQCSVCKKKFKSASHLKMHQSPHSLSMYECCVCKTVLKTAKAFVEHIEYIHNTDTKCKYCGKVYKFANSACRHMRTCRFKCNPLIKKPIVTAMTPVEPPQNETVNSQIIIKHIEPANNEAVNRQIFTNIVETPKIETPNKQIFVAPLDPAKNEAVNKQIIIKPVKTANNEVVNGKDTIKTVKTANNEAVNRQIIIKPVKRADNEAVNSKIFKIPLEPVKNKTFNKQIIIKPEKTANDEAVNKEISMTHFNLAKNEILNRQIIIKRVGIANNETISRQIFTNPAETAKIGTPNKQLFINPKERAKNETTNRQILIRPVGMAKNGTATRQIIIRPVETAKNEIVNTKVYIKSIETDKNKTPNSSNISKKEVARIFKTPANKDIVKMYKKESDKKVAVKNIDFNDNVDFDSEQLSSLIKHSMDQLDVDLTQETQQPMEAQEQGYIDINEDSMFVPTLQCINCMVQFSTEDQLNSHIAECTDDGYPPSVNLLVAEEMEE